MRLCGRKMTGEPHDVLTSSNDEEVILLRAHTHTHTDQMVACSCTPTVFQPLSVLHNTPTKHIDGTHLRDDAPWHIAVYIGAVGMRRRYVTRRCDAV